MVDYGGHSSLYITVNYIGTFDTKTQVFWYAQNAPQRYGGYSDAYNNAAFLIGCDIAWLTTFFNYNGFEWRIEFWKGNYRKICAGKVSTGAEIGIYFRNKSYGYVLGTKWYRAAYESCYWMNMYISLYRNNSFVLSRPEQKAWWLTGFKVGHKSKPNKWKISYSFEFYK